MENTVTTGLGAASDRTAIQVRARRRTKRAAASASHHQTQDRHCMQQPACRPGVALHFPVGGSVSTKTFGGLTTHDGLDPSAELLSYPSSRTLTTVAGHSRLGPAVGNRCFASIIKVQSLAHGRPWLFSVRDPARQPLARTRPCLYNSYFVQSGMRCSLHRPSAKASRSASWTSKLRISNSAMCSRDQSHSFVIRSTRLRRTIEQ